MELIDSHGHLNMYDESTSWKQIWSRSKDRGVRAIIVPGADLDSSARAVEQARNNADIFAAVGIHPNDVTEEMAQKDLDIQFYQWLENPKVVAIGEVGLDIYRSPDLIDLQETVLNKFIELSLKNNKPMIFHCRAGKTASDKSEDDPHERLIGMLSSLDNRPRFVMHCYQGTAKQAKKYLELGGYISFTGTITYSEADVVRDAVEAVPLDRLMVETDAPWLSPIPYRGEVNEPWKVIEVAKRISDWKGLSIEQVADETLKNTIDFFGLKFE